MNRLARLLPIAFLLALAACGDEPEEPAVGDGSSAAGEVLEGSISDEMLPYDLLRSQPPRAQLIEGQEGEGAAPDAAPGPDAAAAPPPPDDAAEDEPAQDVAPAAD